MESICKFVSSDEKEPDIQPLRFVYETELRKFSQPFLFSFYRIFVVTSGTATLRYDEKIHHLSRGALCLLLPQESFTLDMDESFNVIYLDFYSSDLKEYLKKKGVSLDTPVFYGMDFILSFLDAAINEVRNYNSNILVRSAVCYVLANLFVSARERELGGKRKPAFDSILDFVKTNFNDPLLSLKKLSDRFFYSENHISRLFLSNLNQGFNKYLNDLRLDFAVKLLDEGFYSIKDVALSSGFVDPLYFSKVFKKRFRLSPTEYANASPLKAEKEFLRKYSSGKRN